MNSETEKLYYIRDANGVPTIAVFTTNSLKEFNAAFKTGCWDSLRSVEKSVTEIVVTLNKQLSDKQIKEHGDEANVAFIATVVDIDYKN